MSERLFRLVLWLCAGVGMDVGDRIFDHVLDAFAEHHAWLAWLQ